MSTPTILAIEIELPIRIYSEANISRHWAARARRTRQQREATKLLIQSEFNKLNWPTDIHEIVVTLTRVAPREFDRDNLLRGFKAVRDGVADALGIDDGSQRFRWFYRQVCGKPKEYKAIVRIEHRPVITPEMGRQMDCPFPGPEPDL